ncbi:MAG: phosphohistidine swiveling domain-containing protein [Gammaproteobacteria bacterium]|jgi:phosphohistidine swiveling domain-containing protein
MSHYHSDSDKYGNQAQFAIVEAFHGAIKEKVREHLASSAEPWADFVFDNAETVLDAEVFASIDAKLLELGHRYEWSALVSQQERPGAYVAADGLSDDDVDFSFEHPDAPLADRADRHGNILCGVGDNVVGYAENTVGTARYIRSSARVFRYLTDGVPANTIAVIDDSGGTLTAPILEQFAGVICAGGTVRSHLGILTREYGIPCLMNAKIRAIKEGDTVVMETTAAAKTAHAYQQGVDMTAAIWRRN